MDRDRIRTPSHVFGSALRELKSRQNQCHSRGSRTLDPIHLSGLPLPCPLKGASLIKAQIPCKGPRVLIANGSRCPEEELHDTSFELGERFIMKIVNEQNSKPLKKK